MSLFKYNKCYNQRVVWVFLLYVYIILRFL